MKRSMFLVGFCDPRVEEFHCSDGVRAECDTGANLAKCGCLFVEERLDKLSRCVFEETEEECNAPNATAHNGESDRSVRSRHCWASHFVLLRFFWVQQRDKAAIG